MEKDAARDVIRVAFRCSSELQELMRVLKERCGAEEYKRFALAIAKAIDGIGVALINPLLSSHPDLAVEIEANLERSGRAM